MVNCASLCVDVVIVVLELAVEPGWVAVRLLTLPVALPVLELPGKVLPLEAPGVLLVVLPALLEGYVVLDDDVLLEGDELVDGYELLALDEGEVLLELEGYVDDLSL